MPNLFVDKKFFRYLSSFIKFATREILQYEI